MLHCTITHGLERMSTTALLEDSSKASSTEEVKLEEEEVGGGGSDLILDEITRACESWTRRITVLENELRKNKNVKEHIIESLQRQVWDGLITSDKASEL